MRHGTERPEGVEEGVVKLVGPNRGAIVMAASRLLEDPVAYAAMARGASPYGDGQAAERIAAILRNARSEEHTSELQSLMRISYAVFCLKKTTKTHSKYDRK